MFKKLLIIVGSVFLLIIFSACNPKAEKTQSTGEKKSTNDSDEKIVLKMGDYLNTTQLPYTEGTMYWIDRVEELTDGQVEIEYYPSAQLGDSTTLFELTKNNSLDIAGYGASYISDLIPLAELGDLPGAYSSSEEGTKAYWEVANGTLLENTYLKNDVRPIWVAATPPYQIITKNKKVETPEDFKGLKIRTAGGIQELVVQEMGGSSVSVEAPEIIQSMERGTVDAVFGDISSIRAFQLTKASNYSSTNASLTGFVLNYVINEEVYQSLPDNVKEAIEQASIDTMENLSKAQDNLAEEEKVKLVDEGLDMYEISDQEMKIINDKLENIQDKWVEKLEKRGLPARETLDEYLKAKEELN